MDRIKLHHFIVQLIVVCILLLGMLAWHFPGHALQEEVSSLNYFPSDYSESRNNFMVAAKMNGGIIESFKCPAVGPQGEELFIDVAYFGKGDPEAILVLSSGTHGVEGFAGSAIQNGLLRQGLVSRLAPEIGLVMIHAINPYGMAHLRRVNEDNTDLNRNFIDHSKPYPENEGYSVISDAITPNSISPWVNARSFLDIIWFWLKNGKLKLKEAVSMGQYSFPQGLFYGGQSDAWSNKIMREIAARFFAQVGRVVLIDFHTGLGKYGNAEIILNVSKDSSAFKRAVAWWGDGRVKTTFSGESVSAHLYGTFKLALPQTLPDAEVTAVSLEFGTFSPLRVFWALRTENWLHFHGGDGHPESDRIKGQLLRTFYPEDKDWREEVWRQGREIVKQALVGLSHSAR
ncbi:MAG: M14 family metallopeptidase [Desulfobulbaceae bacterium]|nr:M14 family metallopeptidase [Desulfobulbaceae bacterium]